MSVSLWPGMHVSLSEHSLFVELHSDHASIPWNYLILHSPTSAGILELAFINVHLHSERPIHQQGPGTVIAPFSAIPESELSISHISTS